MNTEEYRVSSALPEHIPLLAAVEIAAAAYFPADVITDEIRCGSVPVEQLESAQREARLWTAVNSSGEPVGFAIARIESDSVFLQELDVHPEHQQQGLGSKLIQQVIGYAESQGCASVTLTTFEYVPWNAPYYARLGFRKLPVAELSTELQHQLESEYRQGLSERIAMKLELHY